MLSDEYIKNFIALALREDMAARDITTKNIVPPAAKGQAVVCAHEQGVLCGIELVKAIFGRQDKNVKFKKFKSDRQRFRAKDEIMYIEGNLAAIISAERAALNILSRLCGIATLTAYFCAKVKGTKAKILDTRKTTAGLRVLEKYATRCGGAKNHRYNLSDGIIIKDNHLRAGMIIAKTAFDHDKFESMLRKMRKRSNLPIEVEVEDIGEFNSVVIHRPDIIMLDNFSTDDLARAVRLRNKKYRHVKLEASGGVNVDNIRSIARCGVDFISIGSITHSPKAIDFSLEIV